MNASFNDQVATQLLQGLDLPPEQVEAMVRTLAASGASVRAMFANKPWAPGESNLYWWRDPNGEFVVAVDRGQEATVPAFP